MSKLANAVRKIVSQMRADYANDGIDAEDQANRIPGYTLALEAALNMDDTYPPSGLSYGVVMKGVSAAEQVKEYNKRRTKELVLEQRKNAVFGGCCYRFADNQACNCLEEAE